MPNQSTLLTGRFPASGYSPKTSLYYSFLGPHDADILNWALFAHFAERGLFVVVVQARLNVTRLLEAYEACLWRGGQYQISERRGQWRNVHRQLLFRLNEHCFIFVNTCVSGCRVFATNPQHAEHVARDLADQFRARRPRGMSAARFHVVSLSIDGPQAAEVTLEQRHSLAPRDLDLLYGNGFAAWERSLIAGMKTQAGGAIILRGPPGVGKTSFIRHLIRKLRSTHRFYLLPVTEEMLLSSPKMAQFWSLQNEECRGLKKVVVLEDAEELLADRGSASRGPIANLLNISDGLLGDFLRLQVLCTINCEWERLDAAVVRSGRLIAYREFPRLSLEQATMLAAAHGLELPPQEDYSLAEVFCGRPQTSEGKSGRRIGFCAPA